MFFKLYNVQVLITDAIKYFDQLIDLILELVMRD